MDVISEIDKILCENWDSPLWKLKKDDISKTDFEKYCQLEKLASIHRESLKRKREKDRKVIHKLENNNVNSNYLESFSENLIKPNKSTIEETINFSYGMVCKCKNQRSGGTMIRTKSDKIYNHLQGKLAEVIVHQLATDTGLDLKAIDFNVYPIGKWDDGDVVTVDDSLNFNVKSGMKNHQLLLLTKNDYNSDGSYKHHNCETEKIQKQIFSCIRLKMDRSYILKKIENMSQSEFIAWFLKSYNTITYDAHFCNEVLIKQIISNGNIIFKGDYINGNTKMDADNYYIYLFNMDSYIKQII